MTELFYRRGSHGVYCFSLLFEFHTEWTHVLELQSGSNVCLANNTAGLLCRGPFRTAYVDYRPSYKNRNKRKQKLPLVNVALLHIIYRFFELS